MRQASLILASIALCTPWITFGAVLINEIAWMGTTVSVNDEWIELYNDGPDPIDLNGWSLVTNGSLRIIFAANTNNKNWDSILAPGAHALLERTDDTTVPDAPAFFIYTGALVDTGLTLSLCRVVPDGVCTGADIEHQVAGGADWEIGGDKSGNTAQWTLDNGWVTGAPTPGA